MNGRPQIRDYTSAPKYYRDLTTWLEQELDKKDCQNIALREQLVVANNKFESLNAASQKQLIEKLAAELKEKGKKYSGFIAFGIDKALLHLAEAAEALESDEKSISELTRSGDY